MEGWTSENPDIDKFIKDTMYAKHYDQYDCLKYLEWVPFDRFTNIKQIGKGGFAKVYSAIWIDGKSYYIKQNNEKSAPVPIAIALKRLNESQNMSAEYLNEVYYYIKFLFC